MTHKNLPADFEAKNEERCQLIIKEVHEGLNAAEAARLVELQAWIGKLFPRVTPREVEYLENMNQAWQESEERVKAIMQELGLDKGEKG